MHTYKESVECLEDVHMFLEQRAYTESAIEVDVLVNKLAKFQCSQLSPFVQSSITSYIRTSNIVNYSDIV